MTEPVPSFRCGYAAIIGEPNAGKSTLLNALLRQKLSIVANKPQTTRQRVLGVVTRPGAQIVILDTPGIVKPKYLLHEKMVAAVRRAFEDADVVVMLNDVARGESLPDAVMELLADSKTPRKPLILCLSKADTADERRLAALGRAFEAGGRFSAVLPVSSRSGLGLERLLDAVVRFLPEQPALYGDDVITEQPERFFAAEFIREKIFEIFSEEIPYSTAVEIEEFKDRDNGMAYIRASVIVERESQKAILIGRRGEAIKRIGERARKEIEALFDRKVYLDLFVKVGTKWRESEQWMKRLGYHEDAG